MNARQILGWVLVLLLVLFVVFNLDPARVWFFGLKVEMPIALVVITSAGLGAGAAYGFLYIQKRRRKESS
jgi:uncharacterized integral membrane protein